MKLGRKDKGMGTLLEAGEEEGRNEKQESGKK